MNAIRSWPSATTSTYTNGQGILLRVTRDEEWFLVSDLTGLRHGEGKTVAEALQSWSEHIEAILGMDNLGDPLLSEVNCYRLALTTEAEHRPTPKCTCWNTGAPVVYGKRHAAHCAVLSPPTPEGGTG